MSDDSHPNSAVNAAATTKIHPANLQNFPLTTAHGLYKGGIRSGEPIRSIIKVSFSISEDGNQSIDCM